MASQACRNDTDSERPYRVSDSHSSGETLYSSLESSFCSFEPEDELATVETIVQRILELYHDLEASPDLLPSPKTDRTFNDLVSLCLRPLNDMKIAIILNDARIKKMTPRLRELCSAGESELERFWSARIAATLLADKQDQNFEEVFSLFPYYNNYIRITEIESSLIRSVLLENSDPNRISFIGSGPLPLTSFLLLQRHFPDTTVTNIDCDFQALAASKALAYRIGMGAKIQALHSSASAIPESMLGASDVVYLAALVGLSSAEKSTILGSVVSKMKCGAVLVARNAHGLRSLLYPAFDVDGLDFRQLGLEVATEWIPQDAEVVNSVVVFRKACGY